MSRHNHYETINFRDDGSGVLDTHGYRIRIRMHIPEQKKVHWIDLFNRKKTKGTQLEDKKDQ